MFFEYIYIFLSLSQKCWISFFCIAFVYSKVPKTFRTFILFTELYYFIIYLIHHPSIDSNYSNKICPIFSLFCGIFRTSGEKSQALLAFSIYSNGKKLLSYKKSKAPDVMHCLHGIRVISTQWIIFGHSYLMFNNLPVRNSIHILTVYFQRKKM